MKNILDTDLIHCDLYTAEKVIKQYDDRIHEFLNGHMDIDDDFVNAAQEGEYSLAEYLWYSHWEEVVNYLRGE